MTDSNSSLEGLIRDNRDMLGRRYYSDIAYIPLDEDIERFPVKYGMSDSDRNEACGHNPNFARVSDTMGWNVQLVTKDSNVTYFAGPDGFVWFLPDDPGSDHSDWNVGYCVAAFDLNFHGKTVPLEAINYGWYLARVLSDMTWMREMGIRGPDSQLKSPTWGPWGPEGRSGH